MSDWPDHVFSLENGDDWFYFEDRYTGSDQDTDSPTPASGKAQVFADSNYQGASATLEEGVYNVGPDTGSVKNDTVSSLKVAAGYQVTLYADRDGKGASKTFTSDTPWLEGFNDITSSVRVAAISAISD